MDPTHYHTHTHTFQGISKHIEIIRIYLIKHVILCEFDSIMTKMTLNMPFLPLCRLLYSEQVYNEIIFQIIIENQSTLI